VIIINAITKIQNFAHTETDTPDMIAKHNIDWFIENKCGHHGPSNPERFEYVVVDEYFPDCITKNFRKVSAYDYTQRCLSCHGPI